MREERLFGTRRRVHGIGGLVALLVLAVGSPAAASGPRLLPQFFGITAGSALLDQRLDLDRQLTSMRSVGTGSFRFPIYWSAAQPYRTWGDVPRVLRAQFRPVGGRPTDFTEVDREVLATANHHLRMLPVIVQAPVWARVDAARLWSPPAHPADYGRFVGALVRRYGARGNFWAHHPGLAQFAPRWWQIWNEPAGGQTPDGPTIFWDGPEPYEPRYLAMLRAARRAARRADPGAGILLAGLFGDSWDALSRIYDYGGRGLFDAVAIHPYADTPWHVLVILRYAHQVLRQHRDEALPLLVTETGWTSSAGRAPLSGQFGIETTEMRQASNLAQEYPLLVAHRGELNLRGIFWYTWIGSEPNTDAFQYAGLLRLTSAGQVEAKPAFNAFRRTLRRFEG